MNKANLIRSAFEINSYLGLYIAKKLNVHLKRDTLELLCARPKLLPNNVAKIYLKSIKRENTFTKKQKAKLITAAMQISYHLGYEIASELKVCLSTNMLSTLMQTCPKKRYNLTPLKDVRYQLEAL